MAPFTFVYARVLPIPENYAAVGPALPITNATGQVALLWTSIGLAVVTSFWQGLIVTIVTIAEQQGMWTFRLRIACLEHWWWTVVSIMLSTSFGLIVFSFLSGNNSDSLGVLTLSTATAITIVRYAIPAWRNRTFIQLRWLSWTGPSRTGIPSKHRKFCGNKLDWVYMQKRTRGERVAPTPSDEWGWAIKPPNAIPDDPTALLQSLDCNTDIKHKFVTEHQRVYDDGFDGGRVSLLWGEKEGFRRRVSRAISSMPATLLNSFPSTYDGFNGTGLCLAMGILGRNKGLKPHKLVFKNMTTELEATSVWYPRPNKVMRSFYRKVMEEQYSGLGPEFVGVAVELALILLDCPHHATMRWLDQGLEQQSIELNQQMSAVATTSQLQTLYRASYTSMILSINYLNQDQDQDHLYRPDLTCFALLWLAESDSSPDSQSLPEWWTEEWVERRLKAEGSSLKGNWYKASAGLLGLDYEPSLLKKMKEDGKDGLL